MRLIVLRSSTYGHRQTPYQNELEKQYSHAVNMYVGGVHAAHHLHIHRMSIDCFGPLIKFGEFIGWDINKMLSCINGFVYESTYAWQSKYAFFVFAHSWISPH